MKNYIREFIENKDYIEKNFDINELKNFNLNKYYDFYVLENHFEELQIHGFQQMDEIPVDLQLKIQKRIRKRIEYLVNLRVCLLNKISQQDLGKFNPYFRETQNFILDPFYNVLNTKEKIKNEINKQNSFLI